MWRPWMFLGMLPILVFGAAAYFVLVTPVTQTPSAKIENILESGAKELEKHIDQQLDALGAPTSNDNKLPTNNDERSESIAPSRPPAKEKQEHSDEQMEALFGHSVGELEKLSDKQLDDLFSQSPSLEDLQRLSDEELAAMAALNHLSEEALLERRRRGKKP